jgi:hypothetical protein
MASNLIMEPILITGQPGLGLAIEKRSIFRLLFIRMPQISYLGVITIDKKKKRNPMWWK